MRIFILLAEAFQHPLLSGMIFLHTLVLVISLVQLIGFARGVLCKLESLKVYSRLLLQYGYRKIPLWQNAFFSQSCRALPVPFSLRIYRLYICKNQS